MSFVNLKATPRVPAKGTTNALRRAGLLPVVVYGQGAGSRPLAVPAKDVERILKTPAGRNTLIRLEVEDAPAGEEPTTVIIKDLQYDPVRARYIHADLMRISLKANIKANIPLLFTGEDAASRDGGIVQHQMREVEVECLPTALPDSITVDLHGKGVGDTVTLGELAVPEGVRLLGDPAEVVASIIAPKAAAAEEEEEKEAAAEPEEKAGEPGAVRVEGAGEE
ncbi:MAG: 50S ribosomal protein L25 [Bacillota bacterium]|jgi:large subunit ribosomal protein L25